jgi:stalled ribosome rescue protein Dom34
MGYYNSTPVYKIVNVHLETIMKYKKWNNKELDFIKNNFTVMSDADLAQKLSTENEKITICMIRRQRRSIQANKKRGRPRKTNSNEYQ